MTGSEEAYGADEGAVTVSLVPTTSLPKGASRRGTYQSTAAGELVFRTSGTGDADLYLKRGSEPTTTSAEVSSEGPTSTEQARIAVQAGETVHYLLYAYAASSVKLDVVTPDLAVTKVDLMPSTSLARNATRRGTFAAPGAGTLTFRSSGTGNVDLFLKKNGTVSSTQADAKGTLSGSSETVRINAAAGDSISWLVVAQSASNAKLWVESSAPGTRLFSPRADAATFAEFSTAGGGLSSSGRSMKFIIDNRTATKNIAFINGNYKVNGTVPEYAKYHYNFAQRQWGVTDGPQTFNDSTYFSNRKRFFAGTLQSYKLGADEQLTWAIQFYVDDVISEETVLEALKMLKPVLALSGQRLAFVATGPQQTFARIGSAAAALGIDLKTIDQVLGDVKYLALNVGEAWGYLRLFPTDPNTLRPVDIAVFDDLPLDLSVVAGTVTRAYQDVNSHVNLKAKERNTPNMVLRDASPTHTRFAPFADKPVHLVVSNEGFTLEPTTAAVVEQKLAEKLNRPWVPLPVVDDARLLSFDELCPRAAASCFDVAKAYGGKSTGLGFLSAALGRVGTAGTASQAAGYDLSPRGLALPTKLYRDFLQAPENMLLKAKVDALIASEREGRWSPAERNARVTEVQTLFLNAHVPAALVSQVVSRLSVTNPGVDDFKFRSSATSEDVANFNGAGLYDSFSISLSKADNPDFSCRLETETNGAVTKLKVKPKSVQCGIKAVFGSLWNPRAMVERSFARLDHVTASMGITVNPTYGDEQANLVLITRVVGSDGIPGYSLSVQKGENLVTNPLPGTITEVNVAAFSDGIRPPRFTTTRYAKPTVTDPVMTTTILTQARMAEIVELARKIEVAYCRAKPSYHPGGDCNWVWVDPQKPRSLDMEIKVLPSGNLQFKQVREFHGR